MVWFLGVAVAAVAFAAWVDWRTGEIPGWLTWSALAIGPVAHAFYTLARTGHRLEAGEEAGYAVLGAALCAVIPVALFRVEALGGGDVKLFIALGALLLPRCGLEVELWSFAAAVPIAACWLAWEGKLFRTVGNAVYIVANPFLPKDRRRPLDRESVSWFRMGPAILVGTIWTAYMHWKDPG
jgi:prepilin peptidase CpaA